MIFYCRLCYEYVFQDAVLTTDEGFARVMEQEYAFIYESPIYEFMKRKFCNLEKVGVGEFLSFELVNRLERFASIVL